MFPCFLTEETLQLAQVHTVRVELSPPPRTPVGIKGKADDGNTCAHTFPLSAYQFRYACNPEHSHHLPFFTQPAEK